MLKGLKEVAALAVSCSAHPECRKFMAELVPALVGEDEEMWHILLEQAGSNLGEMPVEEWNDQAECCLENVMYLLYDCRMAPQEILHIITGVWPTPAAESV